MSETIAARDHDKPRFILPDNTFAIFQLKAGDDYHHLRFSSLKELNKQSARFRARIHDEVVKLYDMVFLDKSEVEKHLEADGFHVIPTDEVDKAVVQDEFLQRSHFIIGNGDRCCWVEGCDTRSLDNPVHFENYDRVYTGSIPSEKMGDPEAFLENIFAQFNTTYAEGYTGRSVSVSDVIALRMNEKAACYFVEPFGFQEIPGFLPDNHLKNAEISVEDDYDMIDGIINNGEKRSIREELSEYHNMIEAYSHPFPTIEKKDHSDLEH